MTEAGPRSTDTFLDSEADKLGYTVARDRHGFLLPTDEDHPMKETNNNSRPRKHRPTGRAAVEVSGMDVSLRIAKEAARTAEPVSSEERKATYLRGAAATRATLRSPTEKALDRYDEELSMADPDYRDRDTASAERMLSARLRKIRDSKT